MNVGFAILDWIQEHMRCELLDSLMPFISFLDNGGWIWILTSLILIATKKYRNYGVLILMGLSTGVLIGNLGIKHLVMRPRPCWINTDVDMLVKVLHDYSFPSGHSLSSAIAATIITAADWRMGIPAWILAIAISFSRLYLYMHFPGDVLGGMILGIGIAAGYLVLMKKFLNEERKI